MAFTTTDNVQIFLNKSSLATDEEAIVDLLIPMVDGVIKNYCGWEILAKDYTKSFNGNGTATLDLRIYPINTITSVTIGGDDVTSSVSINKDDGIIYFTSSAGLTFSSGTLNVDVQYNAGYTESPADLTYAASWLVALNFKRIKEESLGIEKEKFNDIDVTYDKTDIPIMVKHVLDRYRYISIF